MFHFYHEKKQICSNFLGCKRLFFVCERWFIHETRTFIIGKCLYLVLLLFSRFAFRGPSAAHNSSGASPYARAFVCTVLADVLIESESALKNANLLLALFCTIAHIVEDDVRGQHPFS